MNPQAPSQPAPAPIPAKPKSGKLWMILTLLLVIGLGVRVFMWKPWQANVKASDRTVSVNGSATVTAVPYEFVFSPTYDFTSADKATAITNLTAKSTDIVAQLKKLGVANDKIKTDANNYSGYYSVDSSGNST